MKQHQFVQRRLYDLIKRSGPIRLKDIESATGIKDNVLSSLLCKMRQKGCIQKAGNTHRARWEVCGPPPKDMRGRTEGSEIGREKGVLGWRDNLAKAAAARGRDPNAYICKPVAGCALEECWQVPHVLRHWEKKAA